MNPNSHNSFNQDDQGSGSSPGAVRFPEIDRSGTGEDTLRLIAGLSAPDGLETRVHAALRTAPRRGRILSWPLRAEAAWVRATAAAAIVMVVAGGGWGIYSRIPPMQAAKPPVPARVGGAGAMSSADARRSPQTLQLPVVSATPKPAVATQPKKKIHKKAAAPGVQAPTVTPASK